jgi:CO/xanthine dehydrogenase Mo-binding subunit
VISVSGASWKVERVTCAVDCGTVVDLEGAIAQIRSGILFGLNAAMNGAITIKDGRVEQSNFHDYPLLRINEAPQINVHFIPSAEPPTGLGEVGVPPIAPAVANAVFKATGRRLRKLPFTLQAS